MHICIEGRAADVFETPGHLIAVAARAFARLSEARLRPYGFGLGQLPVVVALDRGFADTQRDLAEFLGIRQPPMAQLLARLRRDGMVTSTADAGDGRVARLTLTDEARNRMPDALAELFRGNDEAMTGFSGEDAAHFVSLLRRLIANLEAMAEPGGPASGASAANRAGEKRTSGTR